MLIEKIFVGGWFQRTTLHLSEIYDFLKEASSPLELDKKELVSRRTKLGIEKLELDFDFLEYIKISASRGVEIKIFEDGLILLAKTNEKDIKDDIADLTSYYETKLSPAISYIFSLGAPVPKELANIKTIYPYFIVLEKAGPDEIRKLLENFAQEKYFEVKEKTFEIYRGDKLYIINNLKENLEDIERFVREQIFLREFKGQLHRYLNLHRIIWERIAGVKEKGEIKGADIGSFRTKIEAYSKTINLIDARINQMGSYIPTRAAIIKNDPRMKNFSQALQFKHETLLDTLNYIKDLWEMTGNYVDSALSLFTSIQAKSTEASVKNLAIVTSMGVGATLIGLFSQKAPQFTKFGILYFFILAFVGYASNEIMKRVSAKRMYQIKGIEADKDIK